MTITTHITECPIVDPVHDHDDVVSTLSAAFHRDPVFEWIYEDESWRREAVPHFFSLIAPAFASRSQSRVTPAGDGAALWLPPGEQLVDDEEAEALMAEIASDAGPAAGRLMHCFEVLEAHHPTEPHWYLGFLGVQPSSQGHGVGSALLRATLTHCDEVGEPAYLEATSAHNRRLYERHGFRVLRELPMPDGPSLFPMWRDPRAGGQPC
jgi:GNAT superfamily N-acetyltransferase